MNEIIYPEVRTYYICFDDERTEVKSYGWVDPNQVFETIWIFDEFTDEEQWVAELLEWGIVPDIDEQGNLVFIMEILLSSLSEIGVIGIFLGTLLFYLNRITEDHKTERSEWSKANQDHVNRFADIIEKNTQELANMRVNVRENKCKMK